VRRQFGDPDRAQHLRREAAHCQHETEDTFDRTHVRTLAVVADSFQTPESDPTTPAGPVSASSQDAQGGPVSASSKHAQVAWKA